ncbi:MAG: PhoX family phosphatase [Dehalococcoidia bacterium]
MTDNRRQFLRFFDSRPAVDQPPNRCIWKCGAACFHTAPNEARASQAFEHVLNRRMGRRAMLRGAAAVTAPFVLAATPVGRALGLESPLAPRRADAAVRGTGLAFRAIQLNQLDRVTVPTGYQSQVLLRWGDPLFDGVDRLTSANASKELQEQTFGYNCDLNAWFGLPAGQRSSSHGLLCVNHEYTEGERMFEDYDPDAPTRAQVDVELAAHGMSIVELRRTGNTWGVVRSSHFNRRITATTPITLAGPLAGDARLKTSTDATGKTVLGMLNNCAGGKTPWGTVLTAEENWNQYFGNNDAVTNSTQKALNARYGVSDGATSRGWEQVHSRFDLAAEPNEVNRFGYVVEIDPYNPDFTPIKHTALGRFKHEAATIALANDGRVVAYSGDDERFEYLYKFVSRKKYDPNAPRISHLDVLDDGTLYVARFDDDGTGTWLPLVAGQGALASWSQADILINTRAAADELGATPMDRPEDVEVNPLNNRIYMALTNNTRREEADVDGANPRGPNRYGHILEMTEAGGDMAATRFSWEVFMICGDPSDETTYFAGYDKSQVSAISSPDNVAFDRTGNLWIATDGQPGTIDRNDTVFAVPTGGPERGHLQPFLSVPKGAEVCGPEFNADETALFVNVQHPGESSESPDAPQSVWPDGTWPPLPSLVVVTKTDGGRIGT